MSSPTRCTAWRTSRRGVAQPDHAPHDPRHGGNGVVVEFQPVQDLRCQPGTFLWMAVKMIDSLGIRGQAEWFPKIMKQACPAADTGQPVYCQRFQRMLATVKQWWGLCCSVSIMASNSGRITAVMSSSQAVRSVSGWADSSSFTSSVWIRSALIWRRLPASSHRRLSRIFLNGPSWAAKSAPPAASAGHPRQTAPSGHPRSG